MATELEEACNLFPIGQATSFPVLGAIREVQTPSIPRKFFPAINAALRADESLRGFPGMLKAFRALFWQTGPSPLPSRFPSRLWQHNGPAI
jgi:hypothetical protein